jgi:uncharacterized protein YgiB involved in biofilm formation
MEIHGAVQQYRSSAGFGIDFIPIVTGFWLARSIKKARAYSEDNGRQLYVFSSLTEQE